MLSVLRLEYGSDDGNVAVLLPGFAIKVIAKPGNKTAVVPWPDPYVHTKIYTWKNLSENFANIEQNVKHSFQAS